MIYQLTTPAILLACGAAVVALTVRAGWGRQLAWIGGCGFCGWTGEFFSLGHNQIQVEITRNEKFIRDTFCAWLPKISRAAIRSLSRCC